MSFVTINTSVDSAVGVEEVAYNGTTTYLQQCTQGMETVIFYPLLYNTSIVGTESAMLNCSYYDTIVLKVNYKGTTESGKFRLKYYTNEGVYMYSDELEVTNTGISDVNHPSEYVGEVVTVDARGWYGLRVIPTEIPVNGRVTIYGTSKDTTHLNENFLHVFNGISDAALAGTLLFDGASWQALIDNLNKSYGLGGVNHDGYGLTFGGYDDSNNLLNSTSMYDTNTWTQQTSMNKGRALFVGTHSTGHTYTFYGSIEGNSNVRISELFTNNTWSFKLNAPSPGRSFAAGYGIGTNGYSYIVGGLLSG